MSAVDPLDAVQVGLYSLLSGDATLTALAPVFDGVPEPTNLDYVRIGEATAIADGVHGREGRQIAATIHSFASGESFAKVNAIGGRIAALLWHRHADLDALVSGHKVWRIDHEFTQTLDDPEPHVRHRVDRFRLFTSQEA